MTICVQVLVLTWAAQLLCCFIWHTRVVYASGAAGYGGNGSGTLNNTRRMVTISSHRTPNARLKS